MLKELFQLLYLKHCNFEKSLFLCHDHHIFSLFFILHISPRQLDSFKYVLSQNARLCMCTHSTVCGTCSHRLALVCRLKLNARVKKQSSILPS